jgi:hypothetical protein
MRITLRLDDDLATLLDRERERTGESLSAVVNRLLRRGLGRSVRRPRPAELPTLPGHPVVDIVDTSAVLAAEEDAERPTLGSS